MAPVAPGREQRAGDRRAQPLARTTGRAGTGVIVDSWPLMRAGIRQMLTEADVQVVGDDVSLDAVGDPVHLDLAILGVTREPLLDAVGRVRGMVGPDADGHPHVMVLLERIDAVELRQLLSLGVAGVVQRTAGLDELGQACAGLLAGQRVLSGGVLSVLASAGLELSAVPSTPVAASDDRPLTPKESEVLAHLASDRSNAEIATHMHLSGATVKTHLSNIYAKLGVPGRRQAVMAAVERGLLS